MTTLPNKTSGTEAVEFLGCMPIVRIFDVAKAEEFYLGFLGFAVDWTHRFHPRAPLYMQISRGALKLHLSEHFGDATPGGNMCIYMTGLEQLHAELIGKSYPYLRPGLEADDGRLEMQLVDPFGNRMRFTQMISPAGI